MDNKRALEIVNALAAGADPFTGEAIGRESVLQNPETIRALFMASQALHAVPDDGARKRRRRHRVGGPRENAGKPWTEDEDRQLLAEFDAGQDGKHIAALHARTRGGIRSRLVKLGRLDAASFEAQRTMAAEPPTRE